MMEISVGEGMVIKAILDTGSEANLLSGSIYGKPIKLARDAHILHLENVTLVTAFGKMSNRIKKQAMIEFATDSDLF
jgi:hypothetical protein